jgi:hypothetical protein
MIGISLEDRKYEDEALEVFKRQKFRKAVTAQRDPRKTALIRCIESAYSWSWVAGTRPHEPYCLADYHSPRPGIHPFLENGDPVDAIVKASREAFFCLDVIRG